MSLRPREKASVGFSFSHNTVLMEHRPEITMQPLMTTQETWSRAILRTEENADEAHFAILFLDLTAFFDTIIIDT